MLIEGGGTIVACVVAGSKRGMRDGTPGTEDPLGGCGRPGRGFCVEEFGGGTVDVEGPAGG